MVIHELLIRIFEPDPLMLKSMEELESCEKNLLEALRRVKQRKVERKTLVLDIAGACHACQKVPQLTHFLLCRKIC